MPTYLQQVQAHCTEIERKQRKQTIDAARAASWRDTMRPLKDRLADLLSTIPEEIRNTGLSMGQLQIQLRGRTTANPHPGDVANALRQLGYRRVRLWKQTDTSGFNAVWREKSCLPVSVAGND